MTCVLSYKHRTTSVVHTVLTEGGANISFLCWTEEKPRICISTKTKQKAVGNGDLQWIQRDAQQTAQKSQTRQPLALSQYG